MANKTVLTHNDILLAAGSLALMLRGTMRAGDLNCYPVPRGGVPAAYALRSVAPYIQIVDDMAKADFILDDLIDSGATRQRVLVQSIGKRAFSADKFAALFTKRPAQDAEQGYYLHGQAVPADSWLVFPWEATEEGSANDIVTRFLQFIGEDPEREGLRETPARVIKAWGEWFDGYKTDPKEVLKSFEDGAEGVNEMVLVKDIPVYSHCEHHLAPFFGVAHVSYIPNGKIVGLSKLVRLVRAYSRRLQVQERLTNQVADALVDELKAKGVGVVVECRHMCMESRGVTTSGTTTVTSAMRGAMLDKPEARAELLSLVRRG